MNYFIIFFISLVHEVLKLAKKMKIETNNSKVKWHLFKIKDSVLDDDLLKGVHIELFYNSQAVIDGCLGVYEYNDTYLKLRLKKGAIIFCGEKFDIVNFENQTITVKGNFNSLEFCQ